MASEEIVIATKLDELQKEIAEKERKHQEYVERRQRERGTQVAERGGRATSLHEHRAPPLTDTEVRLAEAQKTIRRLKRQNQTKSQMETWKIQVALLEELKAQVVAQRTESHTQFTTMQDTTKQSSRQGFWLTIGTSSVSLVLGWLLSLLSTPAGVLHAFGR